MAETSVLVADNLEFSYGTTRVIDHVSLAVRHGEVMGLIGRSGSGKTTLLHLMAALISPSGGTVSLDDERIDHLSEERRSRLRLRRFGFVFQFGELVPELTIAENVELPLRLSGWDFERAKSERDAVLTTLDIADLAERRPGEVSGGEMQRAAVARAVVHRPDVVFADEPTGALDTFNRDLVLGVLIDTVRAIGASLIVATHDLGASPLMDRCLTIDNGRVSPFDA